MIILRGSTKALHAFGSEFNIKWRELLRLFNYSNFKDKKVVEIENHLLILKGIILSLTRQERYIPITKELIAVSTIITTIEQKISEFEAISNKTEFQIRKRKIEDEIILLRAGVILAGNKKSEIDLQGFKEKRRQFLKTMGAAAVTGVAATLLPKISSAVNNPQHQLGKKAFNFSQLNINHNSTRYNSLLGPQDFKGKVILVNFWASWCQPCIKEFPEFEKAKQKYPEIVILAVEAEGEPHWKNIITTISKMSFPILSSEGVAAATFSYTHEIPPLKFGASEEKLQKMKRMIMAERMTKGKRSSDMGLHVQRLYGGESLPQTFLIDKKGIVRAVYSGAITLAKIERNLQTLL